MINNSKKTIKKKGGKRFTKGSGGVFSALSQVPSSFNNTQNSLEDPSKEHTLIFGGKKTRKKKGGYTYYPRRELTEDDYHKINQKIEDHEIENIMVLYQRFLSEKHKFLANQLKKYETSVEWSKVNEIMNTEWNKEIERLVRRERSYKLIFDGIQDEEERKKAIKSERGNWIPFGLSGGRKKASYKSKKGKKKTKKRKHTKTKNRRKK
uniref:Uncharacterized protein n=1 Tax=viral metagenome TaxID=1070528 RepID=A0A6C0BSG5_9ZZZZ